MALDGLSVVPLGLSLKLMHNEPPESEKLEDRENPDDNIIRKDAGYDKGVSNFSGDGVSGDHAMLHGLYAATDIAFWKKPNTR
jgi:hypothetical protein